MNLKCNDPMKNWTDAQKACKAWSPLARLVTPDSMADEGEITVFMITIN